MEKAKYIKNREYWEDLMGHFYEIIDERKELVVRVNRLWETLEDRSEERDKLVEERDKLLAENELLKKELNKFINQ